MNERILIASNSFDRYTTHPVVEALTELNAEPILYESDKVFSGEDTLTISFDSHLSAYYNEVDVSAEKVNAAQQLSLTREVMSVQEALWQSIPEQKWLNYSPNMQRADEKIGQLATAKALGFNVAPTVISNSWQEIESALQTNELIMKMPFGLLRRSNDAFAMYATKLSAEKRRQLSIASPFPGIFQPYLPKAREWRVTMLMKMSFRLLYILTSLQKMTGGSIKPQGLLSSKPNLYQIIQSINA